MPHAILWIALLAGTSAAAGVKYIAVVETDVNAQSGASADINPAEVKEITAELRRQATEHLPSDRYSVMTSETVQSMGGAILEECAEENCVVALGSRIGADYIVRGTISKFQTRFTLAVEMYETENGTLVVSSEAVRSENLGELLDKTAVACANMFKKFAGTKIPSRKSKPVAVGVMPDKSGRGYYFAPKYQVPLGTPVSWGGVNLEGGWTWGNGLFFGMDLSASVEKYKNMFGIGLSLGNVYVLTDALQFVYGLSMGYWDVWNRHYEYEAYGYTYDSKYHEVDCLAPFVKLRWNYLELTYRGLLGYKSVRGEEDITPFAYNHQLMTGLYLSGQRREGMIYDYYFTAKYQIQLFPRNGVNLEGGLIWGNGVFLGVDLSTGFEPQHNKDILMCGIGFSLGNIYDLWGALQLVYGGSVGFWMVQDGYKNYGSNYESTEYDYLAPFVKLRWNYLEIMYRGLLGYKEGYDGYYGVDDVKRFGWNNHQVMLGFYLATSKRAR